MSDLGCLALLEVFITLFIDIVSQTNIALGNAASIVSYQCQPNLVISDVDIGMMPGVIGEIGDAVYEFHRFQKVIESKGSNQFALLEFPFGEACEGRFDLCLVQNLGHSCLLSHCCDGVYDLLVA